jgi:hypothetical protein
MQPNPAALEHQRMFEDEIEPEVRTDEEFFEKFIATKKLEAVGINIARLEKELAPIHQRAEGIHHAIAKTATPKTSAATLAKNAPSASAKVARTEITKFSDGDEVHAELDEFNRVLRTFTVTKGAA